MNAMMNDGTYIEVHSIDPDWVNMWLHPDGRVHLVNNRPLETMAVIKGKNGNNYNRKKLEALMFKCMKFTGEDTVNNLVAHMIYWCVEHCIGEETDFALQNAVYSFED